MKHFILRLVSCSLLFIHIPIYMFCLNSYSSLCYLGLLYSTSQWHGKASLSIPIILSQSSHRSKWNLIHCVICWFDELDTLFISLGLSVRKMSCSLVIFQEKARKEKKRTAYAIRCLWLTSFQTYCEDSWHRFCSFNGLVIIWRSHTLETGTISRVIFSHICQHRICELVFTAGVKVW